MIWGCASTSTVLASELASERVHPLSGRDQNGYAYLIIWQAAGAGAAAGRRPFDRPRPGYRGARRHRAPVGAILQFGPGHLLSMAVDQSRYYHRLQDPADAPEGWAGRAARPSASTAASSAARGGGAQRQLFGPGGERHAPRRGAARGRPPRSVLRAGRAGHAQLHAGAAARWRPSGQSWNYMATERGSATRSTRTSSPFYDERPRRARRAAA